MVQVSEQDASWARPTGRRNWSRPRTQWRDYIHQLEWERLRLPLEELENVADNQKKTAGQSVTCFFLESSGRSVQLLTS